MAPKRQDIGLHGTPCITDAWGVEPKAGPAGRIVDSRCMKDREIDAGEAGGSKPPRRLSGRRCERTARGSDGRGDGGLRRSAVTRIGTRVGSSASVARGSRCTHAKHGAEASDRDGDHERRRWRWQSCEARCRGRRAKPRIVVRGRRGGERGAKRARGCCGCRRTSVNIVRRRLKRERNGPRHRSDAARIRLRPRCAEPECRAAAPCRRGSR